MILRISALHPDALGLLHGYEKRRFFETGNSCRTRWFRKDYKSNDDISNEDVVEAMQSIAEETITF